MADGRPGEVLTPALLAEVFKVHANIITDPASGTPVCLPYGVAGAPSCQPPITSPEPHRVKA